MALTIDFNAKCNRCNGNMELDIIGTTIYIEPCEVCLDAEYHVGYNDKEKEVQDSIADRIINEVLAEG